MGRTTGELENWLVPKRCNVYQTLAFLAVLDKYPSYCNFTSSNQNNVATKMRKDYGAAKSSTIQPQAARTTKALAQYMGFITNKDDKIVITDIGYKFLNNHRTELINKGYTLTKPKSPLISEADEWKEQMIKLQLTNPTQPKCENIYIYPFRFVLNLLMKLDYIDIDEMAMFVFLSKTNGDLIKTEKKIYKYRAKNYKAREKEKKKFAGTTFGNISIKQAPSAGYFMSLCVATGLIERVKVNIPNPGSGSKKISAIKIKQGKISEVTTILFSYGSMNKIVFSHDERRMWDYYYCLDGINYPVEIEIKNKTATNIYVQIDNTTKSINNEQEFELGCKSKEIIYTYPGFNYVAHIYDMTDVNPSDSINLNSSSSGISVLKSNLSKSAILRKTEIINEIKELISSKGFTSRIQKQLDMYNKFTGNVIKDTRMYRGAYLELYFSMLFDYLKSKKVIDDCEYSISTGKYNLPHPTPLKADYVISVDKYSIVLEITLLRPGKTKINKDMKLEIEGAIRHMQEQAIKDGVAGKISRGIFSSGAINADVNKELANWSKTYSVKDYKSIELKDLIGLLEKEDRDELIKFIK